MTTDRPQDVPEDRRRRRWPPSAPRRASADGRRQPDAAGRRRSCSAASARGRSCPHFQLLKEAGFEGVELISPNELDRDEVLKARDKTGLVIHGVSGSRHWKDTALRPRPGRRRARARRDPPGDRRLQGLRRHDRPARPGRRHPEGLLPRRLHALAGEHPQAHPRRREARHQDRHRGGLEQVPPQPGRVRPLHRRVREPLGRRLLRRRQRRRVRLPPGVDPRAGQADPQDPHQGIRQGEAVRLPARRGRDRLARRPPGPDRRRLRRLDHRRGRLRRPRRDEGRRPPDGQDPRADWPRVDGRAAIDPRRRSLASLPTHLTK